jgi:hypothetical protein
MGALSPGDQAEHGEQKRVAIGERWIVLVETPFVHVSLVLRTA